MLDNAPRIGLAAGMIKSYSQQKQDPYLPGLVSSIQYGSLTLDEQKGNKEPTYWFDHTKQESINAVGLTNQGILSFLKNDLPCIAREFGGMTAGIDVSFAPLQAGDLRKMCAELNSSPFLYAINEAEMNTACPNHRSGAGLHPVLARDKKALSALMAEARHLRRPKAVKIAPGMPEDELDNVVKLCVQHGFSTIVSANTLLGSSIIDGKQRLSVEKGGRAGSILYDIGIKQIMYLAPLCKASGIKLKACGGVLSAQVHTAYMKAGADETQIATGFMQYGTQIFQDILGELA